MGVKARRIVEYRRKTSPFFLIVATPRSISRLGWRESALSSEFPLRQPFQDFATFSLRPSAIIHSHALRDMRPGSRNPLPLRPPSLLSHNLHFSSLLVLLISLSRSRVASLFHSLHFFLFHVSLFRPYLPPASFLILSPLPPITLVSHSFYIFLLASSFPSSSVAFYFFHISRPIACFLTLSTSVLIFLFHLSRRILSLLASI